MELAIRRAFPSGRKRDKVPFFCGKAFSPSKQPSPVRKCGFLCGAEVLFLDVLLVPAVVLAILGEVDPRIDLQGEAFGHGIRSLCRC
jgi:hypothetical protein